MGKILLYISWIMLWLLQSVNISYQVEVGECVSSCEGIPDGHYTSCDSCLEYVSCGGGLFFGNRPCSDCPETCDPLYWNDNLKYCTPTPSTCIPGETRKELIGFWPLNCQHLASDISGKGHSAGYDTSLVTTPNIKCHGPDGLSGFAAFTPAQLSGGLTPVYLEVPTQDLTLSGFTWVGYMRFPQGVFTDVNVPIFAFERDSDWALSAWVGFGLFWSNGNLALQMNIENRVYSPVLGTGMSQDKWFKVAIRYIMETGYISLHCSQIKNNLTTSNFGFQTTPGIQAYTRGRIRFGYLPAENNGGNIQAFKGDLSCVRFWNYGLSDAEMYSQVFRTTAPPECSGTGTTTAANNAPTIATIRTPVNPCDNTDTCRNSDQASQPGKEFADCVPTETSYFCLCPEGYRWEEDLDTCLDVDESLVGNCGCEEVCTNQLVDRDGQKYLCSCSNDKKQLAPDGHTCLDKDENAPTLKVWPVYGPRSGGTVIDIQDEDLSGSIAVSIGLNRLTPNRISSTHIQVTTKFLTDATLLNSPLDFKLLLKNQEHFSMSFTYMEDPVIESVRPLRAIAAGGTVLTVMGENMDSVANPVLTMVNQQSSGDLTYTSRCKGISSSVMRCPTPVVDSLTIHDQARRRRQAEADRELSDLYIGFELDGVDTYVDMRQTKPEFSEVTVVMNPEIASFPGDGIKEYDPESGSKLDIRGKYMDQGATTSDYSIMVESEACTHLEMFTTSVSCLPPSTPPAIQQSSLSKEGLHNVMVYVGYYSYSLGYLKYINRSDENTKQIGIYVGAAFAGIAVLAIVILVIYCCCCRKSKPSGKNPGYEDHHDFTFRKGMNMPPSLHDVDGTGKKNMNGKQGMGKKMDYYSNDHEFDSDLDMKMRKKSTDKKDTRYGSSPVREKQNQDYEVMFYDNKLYEKDGDDDEEQKRKKVGNDYLNMNGNHGKQKEKKNVGNDYLVMLESKNKDTRDYVNLAAEKKSHDYMNMENSITKAQAEKGKAKNVDKKKEKKEKPDVKKAKPSSDQGYLAPSVMISHSEKTKASNPKPLKPQQGIVNRMYTADGGIKRETSSSAGNQYNRSPSLDMASTSGNEAMKRAQQVFGDFKKPAKRY